MCGKTGKRESLHKERIICQMNKTMDKFQPSRTLMYTIETVQLTWKESGPSVNWPGRVEPVQTDGIGRGVSSQSWHPGWITVSMASKPPLNWSVAVSNAVSSGAAQLASSRMSRFYTLLFNKYWSMRTDFSKALNSVLYSNFEKKNDHNTFSMVSLTISLSCRRQMMVPRNGSGNRTTDPTGVP